MVVEPGRARADARRRGDGVRAVRLADADGPDRAGRVERAVAGRGGSGPDVERAAPRRSPLPVVVAFLLGIVLASAVLVAWFARSDSERRAHLERTRVALTEGHYVTPPRENVRDLVDQGLRRWPKDAELRHLQSAAGQELLMLAMAARASGDLVGARNLASEARELDRSDNAARATFAQCDEELRSALSGASAKTGPPRLVFEAPTSARSGAKVEITARIIWGSSPPNAIGGLELTLTPNGGGTSAAAITFLATDPNAFRAQLTAP